MRHSGAVKEKVCAKLYHDERVPCIFCGQGMAGAAAGKAA